MRRRAQSGRKTARRRVYGSEQMGIIEIQPVPRRAVQIAHLLVLGVPAGASTPYHAVASKMKRDG